MSQQPAFYVSNPNRRDEFNVQTLISPSNTLSGFTVEKRPASPAAKEHVQRMLQHYKLLSKTKFPSANIKIVPARASGDKVLFDYIEGTSAERRVIELLLEGNDKKALAIINRTLRIFDDLPSVNTTPTTSKEYLAVFGNTYAKKQPCLSFGIADINLDNIQITSDDSYYLFDYEWVFEFPIAKNHAIQRLLWWFIVRHQQIFRYHAQKLNAVEIAADVLVPESLYKKYGKHIKNFSELIESENNFQLYTRPLAKRKSISFHGQPQKAEVKVGYTSTLEQANRKQLKSAPQPTAPRRIKSVTKRLKRFIP